VAPVQFQRLLARVRSQLAGSGIEAAPVKGSDKAP
jgi:hypothetical protein